LTILKKFGKTHIAALFLRIQVKGTSQRTKHLLDSISDLDEFGFQIRPHHYWLPESPEDEKERLEMNLAKYEQYLLNGSRFPKKTNYARLDDFKRLRALKARAT